MCLERITKPLADAMLAVIGCRPPPIEPSLNDLMDQLRRHFDLPHEEFSTTEAEAIGITLADLMSLQDSILIYKVRMDHGVGIWAVF